MSEAVVRTAGGYEAATYDQHYHIAFWRFDNSWHQMGASTYPMLPTQFGPPDATVTGALLTGMNDATFIATGYFTGDGSGNAIAFTNGPHGWGTIAPGPDNTLVPTGAQSTDNSTPGIHYRVRFDAGNLVTVDENPFFSTAEGGEYPLTTHWEWTDGDFTDAHDTTFTAQIAAAPSTVSARVGTCPALPSNGTYAGYLEGNPKPNDGMVHVYFEQSPVPPGPSACDLDLPPNQAMTVEALTQAGQTVWVSAPVWFLVSDGLASGGPPLTLYPEDVTLGLSPYYVPPQLGLKAITSDRGIEDDPYLTGSFQQDDLTYGDVTFSGGVVTALAIVPRPSG